MTDQRHIEESCRLVQHLYGELEQSELPQGVLNNQKLRAEYFELRQAKRMLDRLQQRRNPDPSVLDRIIQASQRSRTRQVMRRPVVWLSTAAAAAIVAIAVPSILPTKEVDVPEQGLAPAEMSWDEAGNLVDIHSRIEMLNMRSDNSLWDDEDVLSMDSVVLRVQHGLETASTR